MRDEQSMGSNSELEDGRSQASLRSLARAVQRESSAAPCAHFHPR
jgi:hypothetical protein